MRGKDGSVERTAFSFTESVLRYIAHQIPLSIRKVQHIITCTADVLLEALSDPLENEDRCSFDESRDPLKTHIRLSRILHTPSSGLFTNMNNGRVRAAV
jgi:hypothetical protein